MILEVKGSIFESITAVDDLISSTDLEVYPNPCLKGHSITVELTEEIQISKHKQLTIYDYKGRVEFNRIIENSKEIIIPTDILSIGPKIVSIATDQKIYKQSIIIL